METTDLSARLAELLELDTPPVALAFVEQQPADVEGFAGAVPSACSFWRRAEQSAFYASAEQHFNCPLGAMVMGFELPEQVGEQLGGLVESMCGQDYISPAEPAKVPTIQRKSAGIVYGPLADLPAKPDLILLWLTPEQAMLFNEAAGTANWDSARMQVSGRPGCAALPLAMNGEQAQLSLGCKGMRTFTGIDGSRMLAAVPGEKAEELLIALERTITANAAVSSYYQGQLAKFG